MMFAATPRYAAIAAIDAEPLRPPRLMPPAAIDDMPDMNAIDAANISARYAEPRAARYVRALRAMICAFATPARAFMRVVLRMRAARAPLRRHADVSSHVFR